MNNIQIVKPQIVDVAELVKLWKEQYDFHHNLDSEYYVPYSRDLEKEFNRLITKAITNGEPHLLVAKDGDHIVGFVTFEEDSEEYFDTNIKKFGVVIELYVSESSRKKGVGKKLMSEAEKYFASKGLQHVKLACSTFNKNALNFYEKSQYINRQSYLFKKIT